LIEEIKRQLASCLVSENDTHQTLGTTPKAVPFSSSKTLTDPRILSIMASGYGPFDEYHDEYRNLIRIIEERLRQQEDIEALLKQCTDVLIQMKIEARGASGSSLKQELRDIHQACQMQLASYQSLHSQKEELFSGRSEEGTNAKGRLVSTRNKAEAQNAQLESALRSIRETEELAGEIGQELGRNRESIRRTQGNVGKVSGMVDQASGHLKGMLKKWPFR
jgi:fructose-specific phosphotransferase system component IIB